ncbi:MAG: hypothetical protein OXH73_10985 [Caldilineaceae bacterium]|nr:hypothetical protein [Caldilineaceae bacterium]
MLRVWTTILVKPRTRIFAVGRSEVSAPLAVTLALIVVVNVVAVLLGLVEEWLVDEWVVPGPELFQREPPPEAFRAITSSWLFMLYVVRMTDFGLFLIDVYARLWLVLWEVFGSPLESVAGLYRDVVFFVRDIEWLYEGRRVLLNPFYFLLSVGVRHLLAKAMGGQGGFGRYAYLFMMFGVPLTLLSLLLGFVPLIGPAVEVVYLTMFRDASTQFGQYWYHALELVPIAVLRWLLSFYSIGLAYLATRTEHGLTWWRVVVVVVVGYVVNFLIGKSLFYLFMGLLRAPQMMTGS